MAQMTTHRGDLVDVLIRDHRAVDEAFELYESGGLTDEQRRALVDHIVTELVRHSVAEEQHLYPTARECLPNGAEVADRGVDENAAVEHLMKELETLHPSDAAFDQKVRILINDVRHHVEEQERDLFPRLQRACSPGGLRDLGDEALGVEQRAPTRPHPLAPDKPPANMIVDPGAGMIDRVRDALPGGG
jgi:hemerythrin superfamily protein